MEKMQLFSSPADPDSYQYVSAFATVDSEDGVADLAVFVIHFWRMASLQIQNLCDRMLYRIYTPDHFSW